MLTHLDSMLGERKALDARGGLIPIQWGRVGTRTLTEVRAFLEAHRNCIPEEEVQRLRGLVRDGEPLISAARTKYVDDTSTFAHDADHWLEDARAALAEEAEDDGG